jgi:hypothetical protein
VLARLDSIPGVAESRVDWTGRRFLLTLDHGAQSAQVATAAAETLGQGAFALDPEETRAALDAYRRGEAWMRAGETLRLSRYEAAALAKRHGHEAAEQMLLGDAATLKLVELFERELNAAFDNTHASPGSASITAEVGAAADRIREASRAFLDAEQQATLDTYLARFAGPRGG